MGLRELKEAAHQQYVKGKFAECMKTYQKVLRLAPRDPNMRVRHAEACRRAGERLQAIASYREAANLLLELGCETRARGALKAALELDPHDPVLQEDVARLTSHASAADDQASTETTERVELPPAHGDFTDPFAPHALLAQQTALPAFHRALPAMPSVPPMVPPVLLPTPGMRAAPPARTLPPISRTRPTEIPAPNLAREVVSAAAPRVMNPSFRPQDSQSTRTLPPRSVTGGNAPPVLQPVGMGPAAPIPASAQPPVLQPMGTAPAVAAPGAQGAQSLTPPPLPARSATSSFQAPAAPGVRRPSQVTGEVLAPPPPPAEALMDAGQPAPQAAQSPPVARARMEVRRLSPNILAFRGAPTDGWALIRSRTPFEIHLVEDLDNLPPELRDFSLDTAEEAVAESASSAMH